jgi:replicative DNA helicase
MIPEEEVGVEPEHPSDYKPISGPNDVAEIALCWHVLQGEDHPAKVLRGIPLDSFNNASCRAIRRKYENESMTATLATDGASEHVSFILREGDSCKAWSTSAEALGERIKDNAIKRQLGAIRDMLLREEISIEEAAKRTHEIKAASSLGRLTFIGDVMDKPDVLSPEPRIKSTYEIMDGALNGGFVCGGMYVLAGMTSRGKTTLAQNLCRRIAQDGVGVAYFCFEDSESGAIRKFLSQTSIVSMKELESYERLNDDQKYSVHESKEYLRKLKLALITEGSNLEEVKLSATRAASQGISVIVVDQSSWVHVPGSKGTYEEASAVARGLKMLAKTLNVVVIVLVQVNRSGASASSEGKKIELFHLRDSGKFEEDADGVLILQELDTEQNPAAMHIDLKKHRHGPKDISFTLAMYTKNGLIVDAPPDMVREQNEQVTRRHVDWNTETFVQEIFKDATAYTMPQIYALCEEAGLSSQRKVKGLLELAIKKGKIKEESNGAAKKRTYSRIQVQHNDIREEWTDK